tara:strand:- start:32713 stop:34437 length:1725 start_codon:yes stop_codon:yes gene_type:complete
MAHTYGQSDDAIIKPEVNPHPGPGPSMGPTPPPETCCRAGVSVTVLADGIIGDGGVHAPEIGKLYGYKLQILVEASAACDPGACDTPLIFPPYQATDVFWDEENCSASANIDMMVELGPCDCPGSVTFSPESGWYIKEELFLTPRADCGSLLQVMQKIAEGLSDFDDLHDAIPECCTGESPTDLQGHQKRRGALLGIPTDQITTALVEAVNRDGKSQIRGGTNLRVLTDQNQIRQFNDVIANTRRAGIRPEPIPPRTNPDDPEAEFPGVCVKEVSWEILFWYDEKLNSTKSGICPSGRIFTGINVRIQRIIKSSFCIDSRNPDGLETWRAFTCGDSSQPGGHYDDRWNDATGVGWAWTGCKSEEEECDCGSNDPRDACRFGGGGGMPGGGNEKGPFPDPDGDGTYDGYYGDGWNGRLPVPVGLCVPTHDDYGLPFDGDIRRTIPFDLQKKFYEHNKQFFDNLLGFLPCCDCDTGTLDGDSEISARSLQLPTPAAVEVVSQDTFRGEWKMLKDGSPVFEEYKVGDVVIKDGVTYICRKDVTGKTNPELSSYIEHEPFRHWDLYAGRPKKIDGGFF